jgi:hypothetical protein
LRRYPPAYTNWQAATLGGAGELVAHQAQNTGPVLAIAPGEGSAWGQWVLVTQEQTTGSGAYAGLPSSPHVTLARVVPVGGRWVVDEWAPQS